MAADLVSVPGQEYIIFCITHSRALGQLPFQHAKFLQALLYREACVTPHETTNPTAKRCQYRARVAGGDPGERKPLTMAQ